tara:strand:+ start:541 stop:657 length:117 start_codon:yes stop_codon:yes gene_type:complete
MPKIKKAKIKFKPTAAMIAGAIGLVVVGVLVFRATAKK